MYSLRPLQFRHFDFLQCVRFVWLALDSFRFVCFAGLVQDKHGALFNDTIRATPTHANGNSKQNKPPKPQTKTKKTNTKRSEKLQNWKRKMRIGGLGVSRFRGSDGWWLGLLTDGPATEIGAKMSPGRTPREGDPEEIWEGIARIHRSSPAKMSNWFISPQERRL